MDNQQSEPDTTEQKVAVHCHVSGEESAVELRITNISSSTVHIFDSPKMPYLLLEDDKTLIVLHGVNTPDPNKFYYGIEVPLTRPVEAGQTVSFEIALTPLFLKDHYETHLEPTELHGPITVIGRAGWGETPILAKDRPRMSINRLLEWQKLTSAEPVTIHFP